MTLTPEMQLTDHVVQLHKLVSRLDELHARKRWPQLATTLSLINAHAQDAGFNINDIIRPNGTKA